jgi:hypothetical protein
MMERSDEITLFDFLWMIKKNWKVFVVSPVIAAILGWGFAQILPKKYGYMATVEIGRLDKSSPIVDPADVKMFLEFQFKDRVNVNGKQYAVLQVPENSRQVGSSLSLNVIGSDLPFAQAYFNVVLNSMKDKFQNVLEEINRADQAKLKSLEEQIQTIELDSQMLDRFEKGAHAGGANSLITVLQRQRMQIELSKLKLEREDQLQMMSPKKRFLFRVVNERPMSLEPVQPNTGKVVLFSIILGIALSVILSVMLETIRNGSMQAGASRPVRT